MAHNQLMPPSNYMVASATSAVCRLCRTVDRTSVLVSNPIRRLVKCKACGVAFLSPEPDPGQLSNHMAEHYITDEIQTEHNFGKARESVISRVAALVRSRRTRGRILDIGCAGGYFLGKYFSSPDWECFGVEPSKYGASKAASKGITVFRGDLSSVQLPAGYFDVVTIFDTLSYFRTPEQDLRVLRGAMKKNALLVIEQPVADTHIWRHATKLGRLLGGAPMSLLESGHNFLYDPLSMKVLLRESGFEITAVDTLPGNKQRHPVRDALFSVYYSASRLAWISSRHKLMLGPNFVVTATPTQTPSV
jgi:SAM-dependent methyltransferase